MEHRDWPLFKTLFNFKDLQPYLRLAQELLTPRRRYISGGLPAHVEQT